MTAKGLPKCPVEGYFTVDILGQGGNGDVTLIENKETSERVALKVLRTVHDDTYNRFKNEIKIVTECGIDGVMPIIQYNLPEKTQDSKPWYTMPLAIPFTEVIQEKDFLEIVTLFIPLIETIENLHNNNIFHRDIKPENFLYYQDRVFLTDFGLVKFPESPQLTPERRDIGAKFTMAPEMRREAYKSEGSSADVYSLAKSLWIALTKTPLGFDGQYVKGSVISLSNYENNSYLTPLEDLLQSATDNLPSKRPSIKEFKQKIQEWIELNRDFKKRNLTEWLEVQNILFPVGTPSHTEWYDLDSIIRVLKLIAVRKSLNHMFYPSGGGNDLTDVASAGEHGFMELRISDQCAEILKPKKLCFESFGHDPEWNYFWLEADEIEPTNITSHLSHGNFDEYLTELSPAEYVGPEAWEMGEYNEQPLPETARSISRYIKGAFVFFSKASKYNATSSTYDAWQNQGEENFRKLIKRAAEHFRKQK